MAFVSEIDRGLDSFDVKLAHLGPGRYLGQPEFKAQQSYAPFSSVVDRAKDDFFLGNKKKFITPGVGQYQLDKPIGDQQVQTSDNTLVMKAQQYGSNIFKSRMRRFESAETQNPGPGHYKNRSDFEKIQNQQGNQGPDKIQMLDGIRQINYNRKTASIPNRIIKIYHDPQSAEMIDVEKMIEQHQAGHIGPGNYQIKDIFEANKNKGCQWSKSNDQRFGQYKQDPNSKTGPGKYNIQKKIQPKYKNNPSSAFVSETIRTYYDNIYFQTQNEMKAQIRKETGYKDVSVPGPGQYNLDSQQAIQIKNKPLVHQYFGSTAQRFKENNPEYNISPGHYKQQRRDNILQEVNHLKPSFMSTQNREDIHLKNTMNDYPGVGAYESDIGKTIKQTLVKKFHSGYKGKFGSNEQRFKGKDDLNVGPGQYFKQDVQQQAKSTCDNSFFRSTTTRNCFGIIEGEQPSMGEYNVNQNNISYKVDKQKLFIDNLKKIDVTRPGFDSSKLRFPHYMQRDRANSTADGNQKKNDFNQANNLSMSFLKDVEKNNKPRASTVQTNKAESFNQQKAPFLINSKKMDYIPENTNPGPGKYKNEKGRIWNKRSFNIKYQPLQ